MIVTKILNNINNFECKGKAIDKVKLSADDRLKQIVRLKSDNGIEIGVNLQEGHLHDGDILGEDEKNIFVVEFLPQNVILIMPKDMMQMGFVAHSIGNRHTPAVFEDGVMIVEEDYLLIEWLEANNVSYKKAQKVLKCALKHANHHH
ncbi:urease accessory protein UreE [Helicobacter burdigaliensis]|uniref:urease accessory protein UreE n=1 Tax=Helicobacter burdigaliensis TaxID=2315334 RepID=UPI000EF6D999|nr:urease accessory protein UreE [Helicobacter burdigaliensis]